MSLHYLKKALVLTGLSASVAASAAPAWSQNLPFLPKLSIELNRSAAASAGASSNSATTSSTIPVIVQYNNSPSSADLAKLNALGGSTPQVLKSIKAVQVNLPASALATLQNDSNVRYITPDRQLVSHATTASIATSGEYTAEPINASVAWNKGFTGSGIGVAIIDSGITPTRDLLASSSNSPTWAAYTTTAYTASSRLVYSACFVPSCGNDTTDHFGHGTHVAGLIGGNGVASTGYQYFRSFSGIAPSVNLVNLKVLDASGQGTDTAVIQAIEAAISLKQTYNIRVINLSLGRPIFESYTLDPLCQEVEQAWKAGIVVVVAAGNAGRDLALNLEGYGTTEAPGNDPYVLTVGATRTNGTATISDDAMASYSSKGPSFMDQVSKPDLVAPGNLVTSINASGNALQALNPTFYTPMSFYQLGSSHNSSSDYMPLSGTSMATGVTSGAVALLLSANSALTPDQVKALLMEDANKSVLPQTSTVTDGGLTYTAHNDVFTVGAGYLDIGAAVTDAKTKQIPAGTAMSPIASYDPNSGQVGLVTDSTALWGRTALWGASNVYGASAFVDGSTALWGASSVQASTALWGASDPQAFTALWGATALWGSATPSAATALWGRSTMDGSSTALWGAGGTSANTALWGASTVSGSTALWGTAIFATK